MDRCKNPRASTTWRVSLVFPPIHPDAIILELANPSMEGVIGTMPPSLGAVTAAFFRIVNLTFGGGNPTMAALEREMVEHRKWLEAPDYALVYGLARLTPGTNLIAFCAGAAWVVRRWGGAVLAVLAATVPSSLLIVWLAWGYDSIKTNAAAKGVVAGALAAAVGIMFAASWSLLKPVIRRGSWKWAAVFAVGAAVLALGASVAPIQVLALAALAGALRPGATE